MNDCTFTIDEIVKSNKILLIRTIRVILTPLTLVLVIYVKVNTMGIFK